MSFAVRAGCAALVVLAGCSSSSNPGETASTRVTPSTSLTPYQTPPPSTAATATTAVPASAAAVAAPSVPGQPESTGVPGLRDPDAFCAAWAAYAGSTQVLAVGAAFGGQPASELATAEMYAAPVVVDAVDQIGTGWPAELATERQVVLDKVLGPMLRREQKALDALRAAGIGDDDIATMAVSWRSLLAARHPEDPAIPRSSIGADIDAKVTTAVASFGAAVPPFSADPSLLVAEVEHPATQAYLAAHCPQLAAIGVGDAI